MRLDSFKAFEAKTMIEDTTKTKFNEDSHVQVVDENDKNIGNARIKADRKDYYVVVWKTDDYNVDKRAIVINIHGQAQAPKTALLVPPKEKK